LERLLRLAEPKTENFLSFKKFVLGKGCGEKENSYSVIFCFFSVFSVDSRNYEKYKI